MTTRITGRYALICCFAVLSSFLLHELVHWLAGTALGNNMAMTLNSAYPVSGDYPGPKHHMIISAAGPLFTLLQAIVFWAVLRRKDMPALYPFLLTTLYMRFLAAVLSIINPNDEARISSEFGLGTFTLPFLVCFLLAYMVLDVIRHGDWPIRFTLLTFLLIVIFSSVLILTDQFLHVQLL